MTVEIRSVEAFASARAASELLNRAWKIPAIDYSPEYMEWQLSFPAPWPLPAAMAYLEGRPVGFAAATCRRVRIGSTLTHALIVSFVCVDPEMQGRGISQSLYDCLLSDIDRLGCPIVTWGAPGSGGQRALLQAYERNGIDMCSLGSYAVFAGMARRNQLLKDWEITQETSLAALTNCLATCVAQDPGLLWGDPSDEQFEHYRADPRDRKLLIATQKSTGARAAAYAFRAHLRTMNGDEQVTTLDSIYAPRSLPEVVPALIQAAGQLWPAPSPIVVATNLHGFPPEALRSAGIRQTGAGYTGYLYARNFLNSPTGTVIEVI